MPSRKTNNRIRFFLDEILPPVIRDSRLMVPAMRFAFGKHAEAIMGFREVAHNLTEEEFANYYGKRASLQGESDNTPKCVETVRTDIVGEAVCDVGCGRGYLIANLAGHPEVKRATGVDIFIDDAMRNRHPKVDFITGRIEALPFRDNEFNTVACTHTLEHIPDLYGAIRELRRICRQRLIVIVPMERRYRFGFNLHVNFFTYPHVFLQAMSPVPAGAVCKVIDQDLYYYEDVA